MTRAKTPELSKSLGGLALANLSLGASFAISALFSPGTKLLASLGIISVLRMLLPYQQHIFAALVNYWIPAILIYVLARALRLDSRLRPNVAVYSTVFLANLLLFVYVAARVFASTIEGGGASFVVGSLSRFVIVPAWILLAIGFLTLIVKSISHASIDLASRPRSRMEMLAITTVLIVPVAFTLTLPLGRMAILVVEFDHLCESAEIKIYETVNAPKGIAVLPDSFSYMPPRQQAETRPMAVFLLNQSLLEYIERPAKNETGILGKAKYERMSTTGERVLRSEYGVRAQTQYVYEPTDSITAEYEVRPTRLSLARGAELGLGGSRIEIRRRSDDKLIAFAHYYWNNTELRACPPETHQGLFVYNFVADALNIRNPEGPK